MICPQNRVNSSVPFELIPFKVEGGEGQAPTPPANHIFAMTEKAQFEIEFPLVEGYQDPGITRIAIDWKLVAGIVMDSAELPDATLMQGLATQDGALAAYGPGAAELVSLDAWRARTRVQQVAFLLARELTKAWIDEKGGNIPTHVLFPMLLDAVTRYLAEKVTCKGTRVVQDVAINPYFGRVKGALLEALVAVDESGASRERPIVAGVRSTKWVDFHTGKDIAPVQKCHLNAGVFDTKLFEQQAAFILDTNQVVDRWVKNERLGFAIGYRREGVMRRYFPDFIVVLTNGDRLIVETKGQNTPDVPLKEKAAIRWCQAINNDGRFGRWSYHLVWEVGELNETLKEMGKRVAAA
jgi:type III restriction enzyme